MYRCGGRLLVRDTVRRAAPVKRGVPDMPTIDSIVADEAVAVAPPRVHHLHEHTVEIVSDSGEGAQKCGQVFGAVSAKMGNGVWTVEIIPAEIQPPARVPEGASGFRIRLGDGPITNWGDATNLAVAFNEQVLLARHRVNALAPDAVLLIEDKWESHDDPDIRAAWERGMAELSTKSYRIVGTTLTLSDAAGVRMAEFAAS